MVKGVWFQSEAPPLGMRRAIYALTVQEQQERWRRRFSKVFNIQSHHNATEMKTRQ